MSNIELSEERESSNSNKDLQRILARMIANWHWFAISAVVCTVFAFLYVRYSTPIYKVNATVLVSDEKKGAGLLGGASLLGDLSGMLGAKSTVDNEAEILKTRFLMEQVVKDMNLNITYFHKGRIRNVELYKSPFILKIVAPNDTIEPLAIDVNILEKGRIRVSYKDSVQTIKFNQLFSIGSVGRAVLERNTAIPILYAKYGITVTSPDAKVAELMESLTVVVTNKLVTTINLSLTHAIPRKGEDILTKLIENYTWANLEDKNRIADSTVAFIENRLLFVGQELGDVEQDIQEFKQQSKLADIPTQSQLLVENSTRFINDQAQVETQITILQGLQAYLNDITNNKRVLPSSILPTDPVFSGLVERYNTLLLERDRLALSSTETNPYIQNLDISIAGLRKDMLSNLASNLRSLQISKRKLEQRTGTLEGEIRKVPATERTYLDLARQQQIKQELYIFLLQKREETAISKTSNISNSRVIDPPKANPTPVSPRSKLILLIGLLAGCGFPFGLIYLLDLFNTRIRSKQDIVDNSQVPVVGEIGHSLADTNIVVTTHSRDAITEQFRALRTNLQFYLKERNEKVILLTSSISGEGKSFTSLNLSMALAISGKRVVVMEMDLRKPALSSKLEINNKIGLTNFIINDQLTVNDILVKSNIHENLLVLPSGPIPPNPAELILSEKVDELMKELISRFDYVIIDAPPIGIVADAQLLSKYADLTLYLVRQGYTYKHLLEIPEELLRSGKMKKIAIVVNDIIYSRGGYGYGYGYGYYKEDGKSVTLRSKVTKLFREGR